MANIQTITVDMDRLVDFVFNNMGCKDCPFAHKCGGFKQNCERYIKRYISPKKEYHISGVMTFEDDYFVEAESVEEALELAQERFESDYFFKNLTMKIEDD